MTKEDNFYVTTPIYYPNGKPHIGSVYTTAAADIIARWNRNIGKEVLFLTGTDEHGQKIKETAEQKEITPQQLVDDISKEFEDLFTKFQFTNDYFIRTTFNDHKDVVKLMLQKAHDNEDIYKSTYKGLYCIGCERYYTEKELDEGNRCPIHKTVCQEVDAENYFFKLSKYQDKLLKFYEENPDFISPKSKQNEILNRVKEGLQDISISRHKDQLDWGVELPFDSNHVTYVWFDALFNYYSVTQFLQKQEFWPTDIHIIGHDISWFHTVYWPAMLMSVDLPLPTKVFSHGLILDEDGHKMSKSLGNVINPYECVEKFGLDELRYYLFSSGTFGEDLRFSEKAFIEKINNELNNDLGNLVSRVHGMTHKYFEGVVPTTNEYTDLETNLIKELDFFEEFNSQMQDLKYNQALETLWKRIRLANAYINQVAPWKETNKERLGTIMNTLVSTTKLIAEYLDCFMPTKAQRIFAQLNLDKESIFEFRALEKEHKLGEKDNIFQKMKLEEKKKEEPQVKKEGFEMLNLVVGQIVEVGNHPEADKLYKLKVDVGENEPRQILSGLKDHYKSEELQDMKVVVITNLKPAKMRGELSQGMILAAEDDKGVGLINPDADVGSTLEWEGKIANNEKIIKADKFFSVEMFSKGTVMTYEETEITVQGKSIPTDKEIVGKIH